MDEKKLISLVEQRPVLFDKTHPKYCSRDYVRKKWEEVASAMNENVTTVKKKWSYLRDYFTKQYRITSSSTSGKAAMKRRKWCHFNQLMFLLPDQMSNEILCNVDASKETVKEELTGEEVSLIQRSSSPQPTVTFSAECYALNDNLKQKQHSDRNEKGLKRKSRDFDMSVLKALSERAENVDEHELFFKSLLPMVRELEPIDAMQYRQDVQGLLIQYLNKGLQESSPSTTLSLLPIPNKV